MRESADPFELSKTYTVGNIIVEPTFLSTTKDPNLDFAELEENRVFLRYTIQSKTGVYIKDLSQAPKEEEVLFVPGTVFRVTAMNQVSADKLEISLEEVDL
mgnify:CR=1 FL=1